MSSQKARGRSGPKTSPVATEAPPWLRVYPPEVDWHAKFAPERPDHIFDDAVVRHPDKPCIRFLGSVLSFADIGRRVDRTAQALQSLGVGKGVKVGLLLPNTPTYVVFYYGILKAGGTVVNFNPLYSLDEIKHQIHDSGTELMVTLDLALMFEKVEALIEQGVLQRAIVAEFASLLPTARSFLFRLFKRKQRRDPRRSPQREKIVLESELDTGGEFVPPSIDAANDVAVLQYTGGTTGTPKAAMLTHANLAINVRQVEAWRAQLKSEGDDVLGVLPLFHVFAMTTVMNYAIARGSTMTLLPRFELEQTLAHIHKYRPSIFTGVPTLFNAMMRHPEIGAYDLSCLEFCISGGAALPIEIKRGFEKISGCRLVEGYGLSETSPVATCNPINATREGTIGLPLPGTRLAIRSLDDPTVDMPIGEKGEVCIAGPQVMKGYWNKPEETANAMVGDYFRTGDVGVMDENGRISIVDRIKDMINCSGYKVYPRRIEEALYEHPAVAEVTVIGVPDDYRGEAPKAFVRLRDGMHALEQELMDHIAPKLSKIEMPVAIELRDELPKTMVGKLSKKELRQES